MNDAVRRLDRRLSWGLFALLLVSYAFFYQAGGWNESSRMDLTRALVDDHTLRIDAYHKNTGDKAKIGDHYYSDKAPGLSVAAVPAYLLVRPLRSTMSEHTFVVVASYVATVLTVGIASALLGLLVYRASRRLGASPRGSVLAALGYGLGTTAFPFATQLFSHQLAALLLFASFWLLWDCRDRHSDPRSLAAGLLCSASAITEFPTAPVALILLVYHASNGSKEQRRRRLATFLGGALGPALLLGIYSTVAFGSPLRTGYAALSDAGARGEMLGRGLFGLTYPHLGVLLELLIGRQRGLLPYSPILFLAVASFALGLFRPSAVGAAHSTVGAAQESAVRSARRELLTALGVVAYYLLFVASYAWWQGGSSFGSRHLLPMLPFLVLPLGWAADLRPKLTLAALVVSVAVMTIVTAVQPKPSDRLPNPFFASITPAFFRGQVALGNICPLTGNPGGRHHRPLVRTGTHDSFNLGMLAGARGLTSLLPLLAVWLGAALVLWRVTRRPKIDVEE